MNRWFRWYEGTTEDGKFRVVASNAGVTVATVTGVWAILLEDASHPDHRGIACRGEPYYSAILDLAEPEINTILAEMERVKLITVGTGNITIIHWKNRQFETDARDPTNAERQRRFREKRKENGEQTLSNGSVTPPQTPDTDTDTDTEKKKELSPLAGGGNASKKKLPKKSDAYPEAFETLWRAYKPIASPNSTKADAHKAWDKLSPEERDACLAGLTRYVAWLSEEKQKRDGTKPKHLATFISKRGWEPFLEGQTLAPSIANEHPDIPPERLAEIMAGIERDYPDRRIR